MKRHRILPCDFDTRSSILSKTINAKWDFKDKVLWRENKNFITEQLVSEYGSGDSSYKIQNFIDMGPAPPSIVAFHNKFFHQGRKAFVVGAYYPALTSTCALGERILNQLIIRLRDDFKSSPEYKKVFRKDSFDNWDLAIDTLESWKIILADTAADLRSLRDLRHSALHFNPETDTNDRELALKAIKNLSIIISKQFGMIGPLPWIIPGAEGASFVKKSYEDKPFVRRIVLPNCVYVGTFHKLDERDGEWMVIDDYPYEDRELTDEEFVGLFNEKKS